MSLTENINPRAKGIDSLSTQEILEIISDEDAIAIKAVKDCLDMISLAVEDAINRISGGGNVIYVGAGTSGRLGVLDAAEVPPTFGSDRFKAVIAGSAEAITNAVEGAEDDEHAGSEAASKITSRDMVVGITASGRTPFVLSFLREAKHKKSRTWLLTCNQIEKFPFIDGIIELATGPEIVAGSTRMKAATATKLVLNMLSTVTMIRLGKVYDGLMVDVSPSNKKLVSRAEGIIRSITGCSESEASEYLRRSGMKPKIAVLMLKKGVSQSEALELLKASKESLRIALEDE